MTEQWCLLWSQQQNALHIEPLALMLTNNRNAYRDDAVGDFRVLLVGTRSEVEVTAQSLGSTIASRQFNMPDSRSEQ